MRESLSKINEHITKVTSMQSEINTEKNKDGITTAQTNAITANTAKTGISSSQASAITANTAKTGITTAQASAITANTSKTGISTAQGKQLQQLAAGTIPVTGGSLIFSFNAKNGDLTFTWRTGKTVKTGKLNLS